MDNNGIDISSGKKISIHRFCFSGDWNIYYIIYLYALLILFIGISRIYLGVHFPSDIVGGYLAGSSWLLTCIILFHYYESRHDF
jgi:membrane-associated phospholipid phosphatase